MLKAISAIIFFLIIIFAFGAYQTYGQALILPSSPSTSRGTGDCDNIEFSVASKFWRVRKGDTFEAFAQWSDIKPEGLTYLWTIANGRIVSGQGSERIRVKAGGRKTPGYLNADGFVKINLDVSRSGKEQKCSVKGSTTVMVGRHSESNGFANVEAISLSKSELKACDVSSEDQNELLIDITTLATDPENDVLSYEYRVTAGKIVGVGPNVTWDLHGVRPGIYSVSVRADDGSGISNTKSAKLTVTSCNTN